MDLASCSAQWRVKGWFIGGASQCLKFGGSSGIFLLVLDQEENEWLDGKKRARCIVYDFATWPGNWMGTDHE